MTRSMKNKTSSDRRSSYKFSRIQDLATSKCTENLATRMHKIEEQLEGVARAIDASRRQQRARAEMREARGAGPRESSTICSRDHHKRRGRVRREPQSRDIAQESPTDYQILLSLKSALIDINLYCVVAFVAFQTMPQCCSLILLTLAFVMLFYGLKHTNRLQARFEADGSRGGRRVSRGKTVRARSFLDVGLEL